MIRYRAVRFDGTEIEGKISVTDPDSGETETRSPRPGDPLEVSVLATRENDQTRRETRVLRDDGTVARVYHGAGK